MNPARRNIARRSVVDGSRTYTLDYLDDEATPEDDDVLAHTSRRSRSKKRRHNNGDKDYNPPTTHKARLAYSDDYSEEEDLPVRSSSRSTKHKGVMVEKTLDDIYVSEDEPEQKRQRATTTHEIFSDYAHNDAFVLAHNQECVVCNELMFDSKLVYCQGCSFAYHQDCLGQRSSRQHLVTKVAEDQFVLQCKHCVSHNKILDQALCQGCNEAGTACRAFRQRRTALQEQRERDVNGGIDSITQVDVIDAADCVLFRCMECKRAWHNIHKSFDNTEICLDCENSRNKITNIIAWRPVDENGRDFSFELVSENKKEYLVKFEGTSYFHAVWMPGAWVCSKTTSSMRTAFHKRPDSSRPKLTFKEAVPEDFLTIDVVLDVKWNTFISRSQQNDLSSINNITSVLVKYKGLPYEEITWDTPPSSHNDSRWTAFTTAYNDWVLGQYTRPPTTWKLAHELNLVRRGRFEPLKTQPSIITGGELMDYQLEGLNWMLYNWTRKKNAILGDEMGLGKTIQIVALLASLVEHHNCYPFLIVVPNSTCPNWRREIKKWAPSLKAVSYYGSKAARDTVAKWELFPDGSVDMHSHVVITSYEAASDETTRRLFHAVQWQGLIVDEGQRLKNDESNLYKALKAFDMPFKILLTGTPLQNNQRELFNLLQFLDPAYNAAKLEAHYQELDSKKVAEIHKLIKPCFLRRTKQQVLSFLPPMQQIVLPVSMCALQRKVYKSILTKSVDLMRAIFDGGNAKQANLNNILMQLRKVLCHPYIYSQSIEERSVDMEVSHRQLVDASSKLKLLERILPLLHQGGHRVLIFSQFLEMLTIVEDFLTGCGFTYERLDGDVSSIERQKRIDAFNAPGSKLFAFLLSTRAGGVGINLATADTVIILDPDFNPHQDLQALSRAHRIGQIRPVLCFRLMTVGSAEERVMAIGKRKLALEKAVIQDVDEQQPDLLEILKHGVAEIFNESSSEIIYDEVKLAQFLDRSKISNIDASQTGDDDWSSADAWNESTAPEEMPDIWHSIIERREKASTKVVKRDVGRGQRSKSKVDYTAYKLPEDIEAVESEPALVVYPGNESDTEYSDTPGEDSQSTKHQSAKPSSKQNDKSTSTARKAAAKPVSTRPGRGGVHFNVCKVNTKQSLSCGIKKGGK